MPRLSREERSRAEGQVRAEGAEPIGALCREAGGSPETLRRWIIEGRRGPAGRVHLDGVLDRDRGWMSSSAAVRRFREAIRGGPVGEPCRREAAAT